MALRSGLKKRSPNPPASPMPQLSTPSMLATQTLFRSPWKLESYGQYERMLQSFALVAVQNHVPAVVVLVARSPGTPMAQYASKTSIALEA